MAIFEKIKSLKLEPNGDEFKSACVNLRNILSNEISDVLMRRQIHEDFSYFLKKGRFVVHNTIAGGVIFLKEPEIIRSLQIYYDSLSNVSIVVVEYPEPRNATNVKYKPNVGSQEHAEWNMEAIFPNFRNYDLIIQKSLMLFWANYVKSICETYQKNSWFMRYTDRFELNVFWDNKLEFAITVDNGV